MLGNWENEKNKSFTLSFTYPLHKLKTIYVARTYVFSSSPPILEGDKKTSDCLGVMSLPLKHPHSSLSPKVGTPKIMASAEQNASKFPSQ